MGITARLLNIGESRVSVADVDNFLDYLVGGHKSATGVVVNETEAMKHAAVFSCVKVIAETKASLPYLVYKRLKPRGKERAQDHWLYPLLRYAPNPEMTTMEYRETTTAHQLLWGNAYSFLERDKLDRIRAIWPLSPNKMSIKRAKGALWYYYRHKRDDGNEVVLEYTPREIWHQRGLGNDGLVGYSVIKQMAESLGLSMAAQEFGARFFSNDARPGGILEHPAKLNPDVHKRLIRSWERAHSGLANAHRVAMLEEGMTWKQMGIPPNDAQFLETRKFQRSEIAGWYRVPLHMIGDLDRATFSNIEHQSIDFVVHCIRPWLVRDELSVSVNLLTEKERPRFFAEHLVDGLLRGDSTARNASYAAGRQWGWYSPNDVLEMENKNPIPEEKGGDDYHVPMNMLPTGRSPEPVISPKPKEEEGPEEEPEGEEGGLQREWHGMVQNRSIKIRNKIRDTYHRLFKDVGERLVRKEILAVKKIIQKTIEKGEPEEFKPAIKKFYDKFSKDIIKAFSPVSMSYAEEIGAAIVVEVEGERKSGKRAFDLSVYCTCEEKPVDLKTLVEHYDKSYVESHVVRSTETMDAIVATTAIEELPEKLKKMLGDWDLKRAEQIAMRETVKIDGFVSRSVFFGMGAKKVKWVLSEKETSKFCKKLHGKAVTINQPFLEKGDMLEPKSRSTAMEAKKRYFHPPLYRGCECSIVAEWGSE